MQTNPTIVLGIDPGTKRIGYGAVRRKGQELCLVEAGLLPLKNISGQELIRETKVHTDRLIKKFRPSLISVEKIFFVKNLKTGIAVAQARGVILLAAAEHGVPVREYSPTEIKLGLTGYGLADKRAVLKMVRLCLKEPGLRVVDDASDALASAIVALHTLKA